MELLTQGRFSLDYSEDTARTVEVIREENEHGELGSFGFTLLYEKPPVVGHIVPGGSAERAGLKKNDVVIAVNGLSVTGFSHHDVVSIIHTTQTPGVWLQVCDPPTPSKSAYGNRFHSNLGLFSFSQSTPILDRSPPEAMRRAYMDGDSPPRYSDVTRIQRNGSGNQLGHRAVAASVANISPLVRKVLTKQNGQSVQNGHDVYDAPQRSTSQGHPQGHSPASGVFTSASILVLYIGPVEIPETWSARGLSSKCIQECTRRLLSQRQEFLEVFLEVTLSGMKVLNVSRNVLVRHKREELFYCGVCSNDEEHFAIVTRKLDSKSSQKLVIDPEVGQTVPSDGKSARANICHVFRVIKSKSVLVLHSGEKKKGGPEVRPKTVSVSSCVAIISAIRGLFTGTGLKSLEDQHSPNAHGLKVGPGNTSHFSIASSGSGGSSDSMYVTASTDKTSPYSKRKKFDVVDLRPAACTQHQSSPIYSTSSGKYYATVDSSPSKTFATPAFLNPAKSWYSTTSPKDVYHSRSGSWDNRETRESRSRPTSGNFSDKLPAPKKTSFPHDKMAKRVSDESSVSSLSSSRSASPTKLSFRSSFASRSRSPSPTRSLSYSSGSRSRSPSPEKARSPSPPVSSSHVRLPPSASKLAMGLALEVSSRNRATSPVSHISSIRGHRMHLRRQGSESSIMELQAEHSHFLRQQQPQGRGLPQRNGPLSSSIGSVATLTTVVDEDGRESEELGRVAGWVASFDKLLADPLGVQCLLQLLEKEHCEENILFWRDADEFKKKASQNQNLQQAVKKLYDQYLSPSAPQSINIDDRVLKAVESRLSNPPPNIFSEAQEQIYQLMKMDCYPRFKKSELAKQCLLAEVEGRPLPIDSVPEQKRAEPQYGVWKKQKEFGFGRSLFGRWTRPRVHPQPQLRTRGSWGNQQDTKKGKKETKAAGGKKDEGAQSKRASGVKEKVTDKKEETPGDDFPPENHLNYLQLHKGNIFEINLPNKVTKILEVPSVGTVRDAIHPVLRRHGYSFDIMELRFANTFKLLDLQSPASILIGQHIIVIKSKNTFIAVFPDVHEKILPADGTRTVEQLFTDVLRDLGKTQTFAIYMEGSRVPLESNIDTSNLVGQRVVVKYISTPAGKSSGSADSSPAVSLKQAKSGKEENDVDDLISMICRLTSDTLTDQRTSPTPRSTPEPGQSSDSGANLSDPRSSDGEHRQQKANHHSPSSRGEQEKSKSRKRTNTLEKKKHSKSPEQINKGQKERDRGKGEMKDSLKLPARALLAHPAVSRTTKFHRTQSGAAISNTAKPELYPQRSFSPPADLSQRESGASLPPPPTSKPPPLPASAVHRKLAERRNKSDSRISRSPSSDGSSTQETITRRGDYSDHTYVNRDSRSHSVGGKEAPPSMYFPGAYPSMDRGHEPLVYTHSTPLYVNVPNESNRSSGVMYHRNQGYPHGTAQHSSTSPEYQHPLDNFVREASSNAPSAGGVHVRQQSWPVRTVDSTHPLQTAARGPIGVSLSNYPWHHAHVAQRRYSAQPRPTTAVSRRNLTEDAELLRAGDLLVQREIEQYRHPSSDSGSETYRTPLSPTTHMLVVPDDENSPHHQHETFV